MKARMWIWAAVIVGAVLVAAIVSRGAARGPSASQESGQSKRPVPLVAVGHPQSVALPQTLALTASITSLKSSVIFPKTSG